MDSGDLNDPDLKAAIAASLQDSQGAGEDANLNTNGHQKDVVDLTNDSDDDELVEYFPKSKSVIGSETESENGSDKVEDEDEDLKKAIKLSMQGESQDQPELRRPVDSKNEAGDAKPSSSSTKDASAAAQQQSQPTGLLGLDRKQMEQERLARVGKRKAEDSGPPSASQHETKTPRTGAIDRPKAADSSKPIPSQSGSSQTKQETRTVTPSTQPTIQFPEGVVKKTWAFLNERKGDDIKIEEVLQKSDLELAVLSSFMWDMDWLFSKLDIRRTRFILIMQAKEEATKRQYESETQTMRNLRLCFPPMPGQVNCMHSKLMLLFRAQYLRVVVPTANLIPYDWGEVGVMENSVFLIDLPKKNDQTSAEKSKTTFYDDLVYFLRASTLHESVIAKLENYDFSKTTHIAFVHTIGGTHENDAWRRTGYCGLGRAVDSLGLKTSKPLNIDYVTSSIGSLTDDFIKAIYLASQGDDGQTELTQRTRTTKPKTQPRDPEQEQEHKTRFRAYFPSELTVKHSRGGPMAAGTICFQSKWYENGRFPRHVLRECVSRRSGVLMHNKIIFIQPDEPITLPNSNAKCLAWGYVGSANLSESAWGRLVRNTTTKTPKLNCRNWECGVLVPVLKEEGESSSSSSSSSAAAATAATAASDDGDVSLDVFQGTIPVPMRVPGRRYGDGVRPWYFMESM